MAILAVFLALVLLYSLVSARIERTVLTAPMIFATAGILTGVIGGVPGEPDIEIEVFLFVAEFGLVLLLFSDGSRISSGFRIGLRSISGRLLSTGMMLTILLGLLAALVIFGDLSVWEAGIIAAILAPTDAGLGEAIVSDRRLPLPVRESLNVEAGLNDGLSVPFLLFFIAFAGQAGGSAASLSDYFVQQFGYGAIIGALVGGIGGRLFAAAIRKRLIGPNYRQLGFATLPMICALASEITGASMFIAAFVAGLATRSGPDHGRIAAHSIELVENWGKLINLTVFFLFGLVVSQQWPLIGPSHVLYALLSLTLVRMLPVALALAGTGLRRPTLIFMGWFGPRGLASIVLALVYLQNSAEQEVETIRLAVIATVLLSIFAHGLTAKAGIRAYLRALDRHPSEDGGSSA